MSPRLKMTTFIEYLLLSSNKKLTDDIVSLCNNQTYRRKKQQNMANP